MANKKERSDTQVEDAITAFEQILDAMPNDRLALETLYEAYEQVGDLPKAVDRLVRLAVVVADDRDADAAVKLIPRLRELAADNPDGQKVLARLEKIAQAKEAAAAEVKKVTARRKAADITAELALAWNLVQANELTQEDYSNVVHDLTESSSKNVEVPITVLHALEDRGFKGLDRVLTHISVDTGLPLIPLGSFELQKEAYKALPIEFMRRRGAIVFEVMGGEALVAVLNPYDTDLRKEVETITSMKCHYFLVSASQYDRSLHAIQAALTAEEAKES